MPFRSQSSLLSLSSHCVLGALRDTTLSIQFSKNDKWRVSRRALAGCARLVSTSAVSMSLVVQQGFLRISVIASVLIISGCQTIRTAGRKAGEAAIACPFFSRKGLSTEFSTMTKLSLTKIAEVPMNGLGNSNGAITQMATPEQG